MGKKLSPAQREIVQLYQMELSLRQFVRVFGKPSQWYQSFTDAADVALQERRLLERAMKGEAQARRLRKINRNADSPEV